MRARVNLEVIAGRFSTATSVVRGEGWTARYGGSVGFWTIVLAPGFRLVAANASAGAGGGYVTTVASFAEASFTLHNYDVNGTAVEATFYSFIAVGKYL